MHWVYTDINIIIVEYIKYIQQGIVERSMDTIKIIRESDTSKS